MMNPRNSRGWISRSAALALVLSLVVAGEAVAQAPAGPMRYPTSAARYDPYIRAMIDIVRKIAQKSGQSEQADLNKLILAMKDCAGRVEADGVVTRAENDECMQLMKAAIRSPPPEQ